MKRKINEKKGITLIALVVTIIVLLLLAGVSISMLTGQNGILTRAADAKKKTGEAENQENERMQEYEDVTDQYVGDSKDGKKLRDENMFEFDTTTGTILRVKEDYLVDYYKYLDWDGIYHSYTTGSGFWCKIKENVDTLIIPNSIQGVPVNEIKCLGILNVKNIIIEDGIKTIGMIGCYLYNPDVTELGFELEKITIPDSVTVLGDYAFSRCAGLTSINIPSNVTSIGSNAFNGCIGLTSINIPSSVTSIENYAFYGCIGLTSINIPSNVTSIGDCAFSRCTGLTSINIPSSVTSIDSYAFDGCTGLTSINIPSNVTSIDSNSFDGCTNLTITLSKDSKLTIPSNKWGAKEVKKEQ